MTHDPSGTAGRDGLQEGSEPGSHPVGHICPTTPAVRGTAGRASGGIGTWFGSQDQ